MTLGQNTKNLPWVEKYRPSKLEDLVSHDDIIKTIGLFIKENQLPHLLFYGPPGTGKTSTILACAKQMYTPQQFNSMVLELNASDDRGIGIVRGQILSFASTRTIFKAGPKLIILDEADAMTNDAQNALRRKLNKLFIKSMSDSEEDEIQNKTVKITVVGEPSTGKSSLCQRYLGAEGGAGGAEEGAGARVLRGQCALRPRAQLLLCDVAGAARASLMLDNYLYASDVVIEKYTDNVRFCIICNYLGKIIPALQSRCTRFRFAPLHHDQIVPRLRDIVANENVKISEDGMKALLALSGGDMRKVLNTLQSTWLAHRDVTEVTVHTCVGHPLRADIDNIINWLLNENDFAACFKHIQELKIAKGLALGDILTEVHTIIQRMRLPPEVLVSLVIKMADSEARLAGGCSERAELAALVAAFQEARDAVRLPCSTSATS